MFWAGADPDQQLAKITITVTANIWSYITSSQHLGHIVQVTVIIPKQ